MINEVVEILKSASELVKKLNNVCEELGEE